MLHACHAPMLYTCRAPMLYILAVLLCSMRHAPCLPCSMRRAPCSILNLSATGIMGYPTIILYHSMISVKSHTIRYPILIFILYPFERYNIYLSRFYTISYYRRYSIEYSIEYIISFRYVVLKPYFNSILF